MTEAEIDKVLLESSSILVTRRELFLLSGNNAKTVKEGIAFVLLRISLLEAKGRFKVVDWSPEHMILRKT